MEIATSRIEKLRSGELAQITKGVHSAKKKLTHQRTRLSKEIEERYDSAEIARKPLDAVKRKITETQTKLQARGELPEAEAKRLDGEMESLSKELEIRRGVVEAYKQQERKLRKTRDDPVIKQSELDEIAPLPDTPPPTGHESSYKGLIDKTIDEKINTLMRCSSYAHQVIFQVPSTYLRPSLQFLIGWLDILELAYAIRSSIHLFVPSIFSVP